MSSTILLSSGGSTDLKINNSFSLDKECEMKAVETEVQIVKQCGYELPIPWCMVFLEKFIQYILIQCRGYVSQSGTFRESKLEEFNTVSD
jgi:hypothetical protein